MGFFDTIRDKAEDAVDEAQDTVDEAVDKAQDAAENVQEGVSEAVDDVKEGAQDAAEEVSEGDVGGAVDEAVDTGQDVASGSRDVGSSGGGSSGGSGGGGGSVDSSSGSGRDEYDDVDEFQDSSGESRRDDGSSSNNALKNFKETLPDNKPEKKKPIEDAVNMKDAQDKDIVSSRPGRIFENSFEREVSYAQGFEKGDSFREFKQAERGRKFLEAQNRITEAQELKNKIDDRIETVQSSESDTFKTSNGEVSKSELVDSLQNQKNKLNEDISSLREGQTQRLQNIRSVNEAISFDRENITEEEAERIARNNDLSEEGGKARLFGSNVGLDLGGKAADAAAIFDTFTSGGQASLDITGAAIDQYIGSDKGDRTVEDVAEKNAILEKQQLEDEGFKPVDQGVQSLTSVPGSVLAAYAGGALFSGGSKAISQVPKVGNYASKGFKAAGAAGGVYLAGKQAQQAKKELDAGREGTAAVTGALTAAEAFQFYKGAAEVSSKYGLRRGSTELDQKNLVRQTSNDGFEGQGSFDGQTVLVDTRFRSPVTRNGFRSPTETVSRTVDVSGTYGLKGGEGFSNVRGEYEIEFPDGSKQGEFESLSRETSTGETASGQKYSVSSDTSRFRTEGRIFNYQRDVDGNTKAVRTAKEPVSAEEAAQEFEGVAFSQDDRIVRTSLSTANSDSDVFSSVENYVVNSRGGSAGSGGSNGQVVSGSSSFSGAGGGARSRVQDVVDESTQAYIARNSDAASGGVSSVPKTSGGSGESDMESAQAEVLGFDSSQVSQREAEQSFNVNTQSQVRRPGGQGQTVQVNQRASQIVEDEINTFKSGTRSSPGLASRSDQKLGQGQVSPQRNIVDSKSLNQDSIQSLGQKNQLVNRPGQGLRNIPAQGLRQSQFNELRPLQKYGLNTQSVQTPGLSRFTGSSAFPQSGFNSASGISPGYGSKGSVDYSQGSGIATDWVSANLVEQKTGEEAVFPSQGSGSVLTGVKTVQERTGQVEPDKILDNDNGGMNVW